MMKTTDYPSREIKLLFLNHERFRKSIYWNKIRNLVDAAYERDKLPGESLACYRKAFMRYIPPGKTIRKHMLLIHSPTDTALTHHNAISTYKPESITEARLGHMVILPGIAVDGMKLSNYHIDQVLIPFLREKGFETGKGSHYSIAGAVVGEKKGFKGYAITRRGEKYLNLLRANTSLAMNLNRGIIKYGPELLMYYKLQIT